MMGSHDYVSFVLNGRPPGMPLREILRQVGATLVVALVAHHFKGAGLLGHIQTNTGKDLSWIPIIRFDALTPLANPPPSPYNEPSTIANKYSICTPLNRPARHSHTSETCQPLRNCNPISPIKPLPNPILLSKYQTMSHNVMPEEKSPHNLIAQPQHPLPHRPPPATANVRKRPGKQKLPTTAPRPTPHSRPNAPTPFLDALSAHPLD